MLEQLHHQLLVAIHQIAYCIATLTNRLFLRGIQSIQEPQKYWKGNTNLLCWVEFVTIAKDATYCVPNHVSLLLVSSVLIHSDEGVQYARIDD